MKTLSDLKIFNPALIYSFEPESNFSNDANTLVPIVYGQQQDMLETYLYVEDHILPALKQSNIEQLTEKNIIDWLKQIHQRIGFHLLASQNLSSGNYATSLIGRWHFGCAMQHPISEYLANTGTYSDEASLFAALKSQTPQLDIKKLALFLNILKTMLNDLKNWPIHDSYRPNMPNQHPITQLYYALATACHENTLTAEERTIVDIFVKFTRYPDLIEPSMQQFANHMLQELKTMNLKDKKAFCLFLAETFYQLTEIHPFPNANGRTATCWINILLQFNHYPDIVLRKHGERNDFNSRYSKAIEVINQSRELLAEHILLCLEETIEQKYSNATLEALVSYHLEILNYLKKIKTIHPHFDMQKQVDRLIDENPLVMEMDPLQGQLVLNKIIFVKLKDAWDELNEPQKDNSFSQFNKGFFKSKTMKELSNQEIKELLEKLTLCNQWKVARPEGKIYIWTDFSDKEQARECLNRIKDVGISKATIKTNKKTGTPVVEIKDINLNKLVECLESKSLELTP